MGLLSHYLDFENFKQAITGATRYRLGSKEEDFIRSIMRTGKRRIINLPAGEILYRAQLGGVHQRRGSREICRPFPPERMTPEVRSAREGRVNPKGIPCLYLADREKTAMSEVRPWVGANVSIGHFRTSKDMRLMDCDKGDKFEAESFAEFKSLIGYRDPTTLSPRHPVMKHYAENSLFDEFYLWHIISSAFSEPVTDSDMKAEYAPTQVLAEVFKQMGCDGIKYGSVLGEGGYSFALFDLQSAILFKCALRKMEAISHRFSDNLAGYHINPEGKKVNGKV